MKTVQLDASIKRKQLQRIKYAFTKLCISTVVLCVSLIIFLIWQFHLEEQIAYISSRAPMMHTNLSNNYGYQPMDIRHSFPWSHIVMTGGANIPAFCLPRLGGLPIGGVLRAISVNPPPNSAS